MKLMKNILSTVSKMITIAIGDRKATIEIAIGDHKATIEIAISNLITIEIEIAIAIFAIGVMPC